MLARTEVDRALGRALEHAADPEPAALARVGFGHERDRSRAPITPARHASRLGPEPAKRGPTILLVRTAGDGLWATTAGNGTASVPGLGGLEWHEFSRAAPVLSGDSVALLGEQFSRLLSDGAGRWGRVGVAVGSRGIARIAEVVATTVAYLRAAGFEPILCRRPARR